MLETQDRRIIIKCSLLPAPMLTLTSLFRFLLRQQHLIHCFITQNRHIRQKPFITHISSYNIVSIFIHAHTNSRSNTYSDTHTIHTICLKKDSALETLQVLPKRTRFWSISIRVLSSPIALWIVGPARRKCHSPASIAY